MAISVHNKINFVCTSAVCMQKICKHSFIINIREKDIYVCVRDLSHNSVIVMFL